MKEKMLTKLERDRLTSKLSTIGLASKDTAKAGDKASISIINKADYVP
jgi:hypothetical protein